MKDDPGRGDQDRLPRPRKRWVSRGKEEVSIERIKFQEEETFPMSGHHKEIRVQALASGNMGGKVVGGKKESETIVRPF